MVATDNLVEFAEAFFEAKTSEDLDETWKLIIDIYDVSISRGKMFVPETFYPKIQKWFGHIDDASVEDAVVRAENQLVGMKMLNYSSLMATVHEQVDLFDLY